MLDYSFRQPLDTMRYKREPLFVTKKDSGRNIDILGLHLHVATMLCMSPNLHNHQLERHQL